MVDKSKLTVIPGIGKTFERDFARIGIHCVEQLAGGDADALYAALVAANDAVDHATSKNYLYVIRMSVYYAGGGRDPTRLTWSAWKDSRKDP
jgi:Pathogenicity locus